MTTSTVTAKAGNALASYPGGTPSSRVLVVTTLTFAHGFGHVNTIAELGHPDGRALGEIVVVCLDLWEDAASDIAAQLAAIGVRVRLLPATSDPEGAAAIDQGAHAYLWGWNADHPDPGGGVLEPLIRHHPLLYGDGQLDQLLARAARLHDRDERLRTYREFERIWIGEQAAVIPLAYNDRVLWRRPWLSGMWANAMAMSTFAEAVLRPELRSTRRG